MIFKGFSNINDLGKYVAEEFKNVINSKDVPVIGLATGSSPESTYANLIELYKNKQVSFKNTITYNLDEYLNLKEKYNYNSYVNFMNETLFNHIDINKKNTHFPCKYTDVVDLERKYDEYDKQILESRGLDILILGIGNNGHIGFNEPGSPLDSKTRIVELDESTRIANSRFFDNEVSNVPTHAVSMGLDTIMKAKKIILVVKGNAKKEVYEKLKQAKEFDINLPCSCLANHIDTTIVYLKDEMQD